MSKEKVTEELRNYTDYLSYEWDIPHIDNSVIDEYVAINSEEISNQKITEKLGEYTDYLTDDWGIPNIDNSVIDEYIQNKQ